MKKLVFLGSIGLLIASCTPKTTEIIEEVESMEFPNDTVKEGYGLYAANCGKCHGLKTVTDYSQERWNQVLPPMADKAKITDEEEAKIAAYVTWVLTN